MIDAEKIEDEFINQIHKAAPDMKTVEPFEPDFNEEELGKILVRAPFTLISALDEVPIEEERAQNGQSVLVDQSFRLLIGTQNLRARKEGQRGCYEYLRLFKNLFEGNSFTIDDETTGALVWFGNFYEFRKGGLVVYSQLWGIIQK
jgi:hypothetical protein